MFTVRGRTNAVLVMCASEESETACLLLSETLPASALRQVVFVAVDNPSRRFYDALKTICPGLQGMALDTIHLAMTCEYATARRKSNSSKMLRRIFQKIAAVDAACSADSVGLMYTGRTCKALNAEEERYRQLMEDRTMRDDEAGRVLEGLQVREPFYTRRLDTVRGGPGQHVPGRDGAHFPGPNRRVWQLLQSAYTTPAQDKFRTQVLARATRQLIWTADEWRSWCEQLDDA